jgi:hypothetical protein
MSICLASPSYCPHRWTRWPTDGKAPATCNLPTGALTWLHTWVTWSSSCQLHSKGTIRLLGGGGYPAPGPSVCCSGTSLGWILAVVPAVTMAHQEHEKFRASGPSAPCIRTSLAKCQAGPEHSPYSRPMTGNSAMGNNNFKGTPAPPPIRDRRTLQQGTEGHYLMGPD